MRWMSIDLFLFTISRCNPNFHGVPIHFTSLEDGYVLYRLLPNGEEKAKRIATYFHRYGIKKPMLLQRALKGCHSIAVRRDIESLVEHISISCLKNRKRHDSG